MFVIWTAHFTVTLPLLGKIQTLEIFGSMEIRRGSINRIPGNILAVIATSDAIIHIDKESLAGKSAIVMAPECRNGHYKSKFPMRFLCYQSDTFPAN